MKRGVRIVECRDDEDPGSEGRLLRELFRLMQVPAERVEVHEIGELVQAVADSKFSIVHVSTHGVVRDDQKAFRGWWTPSGIGSKKAFAEFEGAFSGRSVVSTACMSGVDTFGRHVVDFLGARNCVAPARSPYWDNAALFSHIFYFKLFGTGGTVRQAFRAYDSFFKNPHKFKLFSARSVAGAP